MEEKINSLDGSQRKVQLTFWFFMGERFFE